MKLLNSLSIAAVGSIVLAATAFAAPDPLWVFGVNNSGENLGTTGSTSNLNPAGTGGAYTADGLGVSGLAGDYAYVLGTQNSASPAGATTGSLVVGSGAAGTGITTSLTSITLTGWFKTSVVPGATRLFDDTSGAGGFTVGLLGNTISFSLGQAAGPAALTFPTAGYTSSNVWTFFAVTYDASLSTNNVNFYTGTTAASVTLVGTQTFAGNNLVFVNTVAAYIGDKSGGSRHLNATVDDYRFFGSALDSTGVLSLSDLEGIRVSDTLNAVPEPSTYSIFVVGLFGVAIAVRRRRGLAA